MVLVPFCSGLVANLDPQEFVDLLIYFMEKMENNNKLLLFICCCFVQEKKKNVPITADINVSWSEINRLFPILSTCQQREHCDDPSDIVLVIILFLRETNIFTLAGLCLKVAGY